MRLKVLAITGLMAVTMMLGTASQAMAGSTPLPHRTSCTSAGGIAWAHSTPAPGLAEVEWTALPKPEPACETNLRVEAYDAAGDKGTSAWISSTSAHLLKFTKATVPGALTRERVETEYVTGGGIHCLVVWPTEGTWQTCTN